jgi:PKD repeat protein
MDYTDDGCMNIFTQGQSDRMLGALNGLRSPLLTSQGLQEVSGTPLCSFSADSLSVMHGGTVHFADFSAGIPTGWNWTFTGGNITSSSLQNPAVTYNTPGVYTVKLRITNSFGSDSLTKTSYIRVRGDVMNSFNILSPPTFTRITTNANDPSLVNFTWNRAGLTGGALNYKFKIKKLTTSLDYIYTANIGGTDSVISLRRSFLDSLAVTMGTTGDSVRCTWRATCYNGIDSLTSSNAFIVSFARGPIGIEQISSSIPQHFALFNNFPNPFNPVTKFKFDLPKNAQVKITVYDITGRVTEVITNQFMLAGSYSADWDASRFASGVYFYRIEAYGEFSDVKKMILVK